MTEEPKRMRHRAILIKCPNRECEYTWRYSGRLVLYATCPSCRRNIKITQNKIEMLQSARVESQVQTATVENSSVGADEVLQ